MKRRKVYMEVKKEEGNVKKGRGERRKQGRKEGLERK